MRYDNLQTFDPRNCISGKVMRISRLTANVFRKYLQPFGITDSQLSLLFILAKRGGMSQKQLSGIAILEKSTLNRNLKRLLSKELITKEDFPLICITEKGIKFVNDIIPEWEKAMQEIRELLEEEGEKALELIHTKLLTTK